MVKHEMAATQPRSIVSQPLPITVLGTNPSQQPSTATVAMDTVTTKDNGLQLFGAHGFADFFSTEVFHLVLHNPTTAYRLQKFSQTRHCGENMEFLEKVRHPTVLQPRRALRKRDCSHEASGAPE